MRARRPAIVYTPTRREAEDLGASLARDFPSAAYHAGMSTSSRERVQADFLAGRLEVIVATIAFGMGVDKADIRTVVHTALPGTLEGFSQEIGRAGRDGRPSRAVLLHSWNDRRTHEFFFEKGYPEPPVLDRVFRALGPSPQPAEDLPRRVRLSTEELETALEKLWIHGGARFSTEGGHQLVARGRADWLTGYTRQREHRQEQLDRMQRFADGNGCRMVELVRHFGDQEDAGRRLRPVRRVRRAGLPGPHGPRPETPRARRGAGHPPGAARPRRPGHRPPAHRVLGAGLERRDFEEVLGGLVRAGLLRVTADTFTKDGRDISFKRAWLLPAARTAAAAAIEFTLPGDPGEGTTSRGTARGRGKGKGAAAGSARRAPEADAGLVATLKQWRLAESRRNGLPAFRVLTDRTLTAIAAARPQDEDALLAISGFGPALLKRYGDRLLAFCRGAVRSTRPVRRPHPRRAEAPSRCSIRRLGPGRASRRGPLSSRPVATEAQASSPRRRPRAAGLRGTSGATTRQHPRGRAPGPPSGGGRKPGTRGAGPRGTARLRPRG